MVSCEAFFEVGGENKEGVVGTQFIASEEKVRMSVIM